MWTIGRLSPILDSNLSWYILFVSLALQKIQGRAQEDELISRSIERFLVDDHIEVSTRWIFLSRYSTDRTPPLFASTDRPDELSPCGAWLL